jgi:hypothetical protein
MIHNRKARIAARKADAVERARRVLHQIVNASLDPYEGYRQVHGIYLTSDGLAEELNVFSASWRRARWLPARDDEFRAMIRRLAEQWLQGEWPQPQT